MHPSVFRAPWLVFREPPHPCFLTMRSPEDRSSSLRVVSRLQRKVAWTLVRKPALGSYSNLLEFCCESNGTLEADPLTKEMQIQYLWALWSSFALDLYWHNLKWSYWKCALAAMKQAERDWWQKLKKGGNMFIMCISVCSCEVLLKRVCNAIMHA